MDEEALASPADKVVLIVDDDRNVVELLSMVLKAEGFQVRTASDGEEAMALIEKEEPHLVVTDLMMPRQGGWDFLRNLPAAGLSRVRVFVITGSSMDSSTVDMIRRESGVLEFFPKPMKRAQFVAAVHRHLRTKPANG